MKLEGKIAKLIRLLVSLLTRVGNGISSKWPVLVWLVRKRAPLCQCMLALTFLIGLSFRAAAADIPVQIDVSPGVLPNVINIKGKGRLSVAVFGPVGSSDVSAVNLASVRLSLADGPGTLGAAVAPGATLGRVTSIVGLSKFVILPTAFENQDVVGVPIPSVNAGQLDLILQFNVQDVVHLLGLDLLPNGGTAPLVVTGNLTTGETFSSVDNPDFVTVVASAPTVVIREGPDAPPVTGGSTLHLTTQFSSDSGPPLSFQWCQEGGFIDGVGEVTFKNETATSVDATFNTSGEYLITFTASTAEGTLQDTIRVKVNLESSPPAVFESSAIADLLANTDPSKHATNFLSHGQPAFLANNNNNLGDADTAGAYYKVIDPLDNKLTLKAWLGANGMLNPNNLVVANYFNAIDLGFGRHMVMAKDRPSFIVTNYRTVDDSIADVNPIAAVAMEYAKGTDPVTGLDTIGDPFTKFYVYNAQTGDRVQTADLDGGGQKAVPGLCIVCHGGKDALQIAHDPNALNAYKNVNGNVYAHFLPFDLNAFEYSCNPSFTRDAQQGVFRQLNQGVLNIEAGTGSGLRANLDFNNARMTTLITLIEGWYKQPSINPANPAPTLPSVDQESNFVPSDWTTHTNLYLGVVANSCRNCHSTRPAGLLTFGAFTDFDILKSIVQSDVFDGTVLTPIKISSISIPATIMPHARRTFERFWLNTSALPRAANTTAQRPQAEVLRAFLLDQNIE